MVRMKAARKKRKAQRVSKKNIRMFNSLRVFKSSTNRTVMNKTNYKCMESKSRVMMKATMAHRKSNNNSMIMFRLHHTKGY